MMRRRLGCDAYKFLSLFVVPESSGQVIGRTRVNHELEWNGSAISNLLARLLKGPPVALESVAIWNWIVDEIEEAFCVPSWLTAAKAKVMTGNVDKTDKLDTNHWR